MIRTKLLLSLSLVTLAAACSSEAKKEEAPKAEATVVQHKCTIQVAPAGDPLRVEGSASGEDEAAVLEAAWTDACAKLPEADRASCKDEGKFDVVISGGSATSGGKTHYSKTIALQAKVAQHEGRGESDKSKEEACKAAIAEACTAAGASGDCVAAGTHQKRGESSSTSTQRVAPK